MSVAQTTQASFQIWNLPAAPAEWISHFQNPFRACDLCRSGGTSTADGARCCQHPSVAGRGGSVPVAQARARYGACGPEAAHLDFPGLRA